MVFLQKAISITNKKKSFGMRLIPSLEVACLRSERGSSRLGKRYFSTADEALLSF